MRRCGGSRVPRGGYNVKEVLRTVWCCNAAHPSVARRAFHLCYKRVKECILWVKESRSKPYVWEGNIQSAVVLRSSLTPGNSASVSVRRRPCLFEVDRFCDLRLMRVYKIGKFGEYTHDLTGKMVRENGGLWRELEKDQGPLKD